MFRKVRYIKRCLNERIAYRRRNTVSCYVFLAHVRPSTRAAKSLALLVFLASPRFNGKRRTDESHICYAILRRRCAFLGHVRKSTFPSEMLLFLVSLAAMRFNGTLLIPRPRRGRVNLLPTYAQVRSLRKCSFSLSRLQLCDLTMTCPCLRGRVARRSRDRWGSCPPLEGWVSRRKRRDGRGGAFLLICTSRACKFLCPQFAPQGASIRKKFAKP